jgi:hypothetical protein
MTTTTTTEEAYKLKPIAQIIKRYERLLKDCDKEGSKNDMKKFNHLNFVKLDILSWVLGKD